MRNLDPSCDELRPLASYTKRLPSSRHGKRIHTSTLFRWTTRGLGGVVLRTRRIGGGRFTCDRWLCEFSDRLSLTDAGVQPPHQRLDDDERREIEAELGIEPSGEERGA